MAETSSEDLTDTSIPRLTRAESNTQSLTDSSPCLLPPSQRQVIRLKSGSALFTRVGGQHRILDTPTAGKKDNTYPTQKRESGMEHHMHAFGQVNANMVGSTAMLQQVWITSDCEES